MKDDYINAKEVSEKFGLYLKVVTSVKNFENFNSFFNIFDAEEEAIRRVVILTSYKNVEEVYDENPDEEIIDGKIIEGNVWIKTFPLTVNPSKIDIDNILVKEVLIKEFLKTLEK